MASKHLLQDREAFNKILTTLEHDFGTRDACNTFLGAFMLALQKTRFLDARHLQNELADFFAFFPHLKPRMAIIQHYLDVLAERLESLDDADVPSVVLELQHALEHAVNDNVQRNKKLVREAISLIHNGNRVLIHSHSHTVIDVLLAAKAARKSFEVIVAEQEASITHEIVEILDRHGISFVVVPEYMLSEVEADVSMLLTGAVTLKFDETFAVHAGTKAIVSEMNAANVPVYTLLTTNKFSFWKTRQAKQTVKSVRSLTHPTAGFTYDRLKFSHDRLPLAQVQRVVTEEGVLTPAETKALYRRLLQEYEEKTSNK